MNKLYLLALLIFCLPFALIADGAEEEIITTDKAEKVLNGYTLKLNLDKEHATVGELVEVVATLTKNGAAVKDVKMTIAFHHIEDDADNYKANFFSSNGKVSFKHQFFDGATHKVVVEAKPLKEGSFAPIIVDMVIDVEGIQPPQSVILRTIGLLLAFTAFFMAVGYVVGIKFF